MRSKYLIVVLILGVISFASCLKGGTMDSITVTPANPVIATGTKQQFTATVHFSDGTTLNWTTAALWRTEPATVTIGNDLGNFGLVPSSETERIALGTYTITAADTANNLSSSTTLSVVDPQLISITPSNPTIARGSTLQLMAIADLVSDGTLTQDLTSSPSTSWTFTSNVSDFSVSSTGLVTAGTTSGTATVTATHLISTQSGTTVSGATTITITD